MAPRYDNNTVGYVYALVAAATGGSIPVLSKFLLANNGPVQIAAIVFFFSGLLFVPYQPKVLPRRNSLPWVLALGVIGAAVAPTLYQFGLNQTTAVNAALLSNGEVFFTAVIAFSFFHETMGRRELSEGMLIVAGIIVVSTNLDLGSVQFASGIEGNILILAATFFWSVENNIARIAAQRFGPVFATKYRNIIGGAILFIALLALAIPVTVSPASWPQFVLLTVAMGVTSVLAIAALGKLGAVRTLLAFSSTSIFGAAYALVFLGEPITPIQVGGGALILLGIYLIQRSERSKISRQGAQDLR